MKVWFEVGHDRLALELDEIVEFAATDIARFRAERVDQAVGWIGPLLVRGGKVELDRSADLLGGEQAALGMKLRDVTGAEIAGFPERMCARQRRMAAERHFNCRRE